MKTPKELKPLIDGDILTYRCGFAADSQMKRDFLNKYPESSKDDIKKYLLSTDYTSLALQNVKTVLSSLTERFSEEYKLYLDAGGNFREQLATLKPYKGNRDENNKPIYYKEIKDYMFDQWNAIPVRGQESDDAIGIEQFDNPDKYTVICSIDKDMMNIPGWHYNWVKDELFYQTIRDANLFLFYQMLTGDTVDNIPGIKGIGDKTAKAIIRNNDYDIVRVREAVKDRYQKQYGPEWGLAYNEVGNLLYIRRKPMEECPLL